MVGTHRPPRWVHVALLGALALGIAACGGGEYPNSTFNPNTEFNAAIDSLWDKLLLLGTIVFILTEAGLIYTIVRFRRRPGGGTPKQVHGNTALEIAWTAIPAVILIFVAVPTVRTIFKTQAKATPEALQVEVIGHQWWWEFRYPQYGITTANELYLPNGRTVNFALKTADVLHSFWIPQLGGKRDIISNKTNYLWFTPNANTATAAWNGFCAEFCGASHANMKFRTYTVQPGGVRTVGRAPEGDGRVSRRQCGSCRASDARRTANGSSRSIGCGRRADVAGSASARAAAGEVGTLESGAADRAAAVARSATARRGVGVPEREAAVAHDSEYADPGRPHVRRCALPNGDPARGMQIVHARRLHRLSRHRGQSDEHGRDRPEPHALRHRATPSRPACTRTTPQHLARWIKNAPLMKPGSIMPTLGKGQRDPSGKATIGGTLTDAEIADVVAYLMALK